MDEKAKRLARASVAAAFSVAALYLGSLIPTARLAVVCLASLGVVFVRMSCPGRWGLLCFFVSALAALLLLPDKTVAILFAAFFGYYPLLKLAAERIGNAAVRWGVKLLAFNAAAGLVYWFYRALFLSLVPRFSAVPALLFVLGNAAFLAYDYALSQLILYYLRNIAGRIK